MLHIIGPDERVDRWQALRAITIDAAWQIREESQKGSIEVGKLADLVILDGDPLAVSEDKILDIRVIETLKEGRTVYKAGASAEAGKKAAPEKRSPHAAGPPSSR